jgi:hypothetical protein
MLRSVLVRTMAAAAVLFPFGDIRACTPQPVQQCTVGPDVVHASTTPATSGQILAKTKVTCSVRNDRMELRIQIQRLVGGRWVDVGTTMVKDGYVENTTTQTGVARLDRCIDGVYRNGGGSYRIDIDGDGRGWWDWEPIHANPRASRIRCSPPSHQLI